jgi:hypothetical protein
MINIRHGVFETNSSSTHSISISISKSTEGLYSTIVPDSNGVITLKGGYFNWEEDEFSDALTKCNYCAVDCVGDIEKSNMLIEVIKEHTGAKKVKIVLSENAYIDHQSRETSYKAFKNKKLLKEFLFNVNSTLTTDNDNH